MRSSTLLFLLVTLTACASTGAPVSQSSADACAVAEGERPFSISVSNRSGASASPEIRQTIAKALASAWSLEEGPVEETPHFLAVARELQALVPDDTIPTLRNWHVRSGDSAVVLLTYRRGSLPELDLPEQKLRSEFRGWITKTVGIGIARALNGRVFGDTLPLTIPGSGSNEVTLEVRFGGTPSPDAAVASFALRSEMPRYANGMGPRYPDEYRSNNVEGTVMAAFIVTATGRVDPGSIRVLFSDGPLFTASVRQHLSTVRYYPHSINCVPRPIVATQDFNFTLTR